MSGEAVFTDVPHVPPQKTPRPEVIGVQTATVVGPSGQEIHTDELGRVRVQFPWDREGQNDESACCWLRVNQGWGGHGWGTIMIPRIGQEVLIAFLEGDPDRPVLVSRVFNQTQPVPYKLPDNKTVSTWKSNSSPDGQGGFNEIKYEDLAGEEEVYGQAEKNLRKLVKNDETITVLHDRSKTVGVDETDTTGNDRTEVTRVDRSETTGQNRMTVIGRDRAKLVQKDEREVTQGNRTGLTAGALDAVVFGQKREEIKAASHLTVDGHRRERIEGTQSLTVMGDQYEQVAGSHALAAGVGIHLMALQAMLGEAADITLRAAGGFVRIDGSGVVIQGTMVDINVGGSPGTGAGSDPELPAAALAAAVTPLGSQ